MHERTARATITYVFRALLFCSDLSLFLFCVFLSLLSGRLVWPPVWKQLATSTVSFFLPLRRAGWAGLDRWIDGWTDGMSRVAWVAGFDGFLRALGGRSGARRTTHDVRRPRGKRKKRKTSPPLSALVLRVYVLSCLVLCGEGARANRSCGSWNARCWHGDVYIHPPSTSPAQPDKRTYVCNVAQAPSQPASQPARPAM